MGPIPSPTVAIDTEPRSRVYIERSLLAQVLLEKEEDGGEMFVMSALTAMRFTSPLMSGAHVLTCGPS